MTSLIKMSDADLQGEIMMVMAEHRKSKKISIPTNFDIIYQQISYTNRLPKSDDLIKKLKNRIYQNLEILSNSRILKKLINTTTDPWDSSIKTFWRFNQSPKPTSIIKENAITVIIDMQKNFAGHDDKKTVKAILREIDHAKTQHRPIIIVECINCGPTHYEITKTLKKYRLSTTVKKLNNDGSREILDFCKKSQLPTNFFRVGGLYTSACVYSTVKGLVFRANSQVHVIQKACYDTLRRPFAYYKRLPNVILK